MLTQDVIKVHFALLRAIDLNMVSGGSGLGKIFLDFKERQVTHMHMLSSPLVFEEKLLQVQEAASKLSIHRSVGGLLRLAFKE